MHHHGQGKEGEEIIMPTINNTLKNRERKGLASKEPFGYPVSKPALQLSLDRQTRVVSKTLHRPYSLSPLGHVSKAYVWGGLMENEDAENSSIIRWARAGCQDW